MAMAERGHDLAHESKRFAAPLEHRLQHLLDLSFGNALDVGSHPGATSRSLSAANIRRTVEPVRASLAFSACLSRSAKA